MTYELSVGWLFIGLLVLVVGVVFLRFHQWVADNFSYGVSSYDRYKLYALLTCALGLVFMLNLHTFLLGLVFAGIFKR